MFFPSSARWRQRLEPRVSWHLTFQASEGPQLHPDRSTPALPCSLHRGQWPSTSPAAPSSTCSHLLSQPGALEKRATLCQVGKQRGGKQTHLRMSGISKCQDCVFSPLLPQITLVSHVFFQDNDRLVKANETLRVKLREAEWEVEMLKTLLKRQALHPVEEDSSWSTHTTHLMSSGRLVLPPYGRIYKPKFTITYYYFTCIAGWSHLASQSASQWD